ncbi:MAG: phage holin family protein [Sphingomonadales bacterium]|nr:phage holin family protein [Sphingomonadales bacterium]
MTDDSESPMTPSAEDAAARSLVEDVRQLVDDGRTLLEAELAYQKSRAVVAGAGIKDVAGWGALALVLVFFTLMALVMGLLLALTPLVGAWGALALTVLALLLCTAGAAWLAVSRWKRLSRLLADKDGQP